MFSLNENHIKDLDVRTHLHSIPLAIADDMVDLLDSTDFFNEPALDMTAEDYINSHRVIDISCKSGSLLYSCYKKFMVALRNVFPDRDDRELFIMRYLLYGLCPNHEYIDLVRSTFYNNKKYDLMDEFGNFYHYNFEDQRGVDKEEVKELLENMKFDVVCGNPPYNKDAYIDFVILGHRLAKTYDLWITPAKFIAKNDKSGKNNNFRSSVLSNIKDLVLYIHTHEVFSILSDGGIAYYLCDKNSHTGINVKNICNEVPDLINSSSQLTINKDIKKYSLINISDSILDKLYSSGFQQYHPKKVDELSYNFYLTSQFGGSGAPTNRFFATDGKALVLSDYEILKMGIRPKSNTTMRLFSSDNLNECNNYLSWIYSKFVRFLLVCGMCVRSSVSDECWRFVPNPGSFDRIFEDKPLDGYTPDENGEYIDADGNKHCSLYAKYKLTDEEINVIESVIREKSKFL